jgi:hypothetical protein
MDADATSIKTGMGSCWGMELEVTFLYHGSNFMMTHKTTLFYQILEKNDRDVGRRHILLKEEDYD